MLPCLGYIIRLILGKSSIFRDTDDRRGDNSLLVINLVFGVIKSVCDHVIYVLFEVSKYTSALLFSA